MGPERGTSGRLDIENYQADVWEKIKKEAERENPIKQRVRIVSFISYSAGKGKKRKVPAVVTLLQVDNTYAYVIKGHEIQERKGNDHVSIDVLAEELLAGVGVPKEDRSTDLLLEILTKKS